MSLEDVRELGGNVKEGQQDPSIMQPPYHVLMFSCSSNLTISVIAIKPFDEGGVAHVTGPVRPSRQILNNVLNDVLPP